jgi:hypothetical protein
VNAQFFLGDVVEDLVTGAVGVATSYCLWLNGCVRIEVQPRDKPDGTHLEARWFDAQQLHVVEEAKYGLRGALVPAGIGEAKEAAAESGTPPTAHASPERRDRIATVAAAVVQMRARSEEDYARACATSSLLHATWLRVAALERAARIERGIEGNQASESPAPAHASPGRIEPHHDFDGEFC